MVRLRNRLVARKDALRKALRDDLGIYRPNNAVTGVGDDADAAVDAANSEIGFQLVEIESRELGQIEHALERINAGVYGRCEFCGGSIPVARLDALPYTNSCIACQRENEKSGNADAVKPDPKRWARVAAEPVDDVEADEPAAHNEFAVDLK
jgi:DnaK suppressor protein